MDKTKPMTEDNTPSRGRYGITHKFSLAMQHDYRCSTQEDPWPEQHPKRFTCNTANGSEAQHAPALRNPEPPRPNAVYLPP